MRHEKFAVFILSHGRAGNIKTLSPLLKEGNYSGYWYIILDNEDESAAEYKRLLSNRGVLFMTIMKAAIVQEETQKQKGGMSEFFKNGGAGYVKPFTTVIYAPQAVKISTMGMAHKRFHHYINWNLCAPKIINEKWKKGKRDVIT